MQDPAGHLRRKSKFIAELRYPAAPRIFDIQGKLIEEVHPTIRDRFEHWEVETGSVRFADVLGKTPRQEFTVSLKRTSIQLEDCGTVQEFVDRTKSYLNVMQKYLGASISRINRLGVRFLAVYAPIGGASYEDMVERVQKSFVSVPNDMTLSAKDLAVRLVHSRGFYQIGPTKKDEPWIKQAFADRERNMPEAGIGLDIDSYETDLEADTAARINTAFTAVFHLTKAVEESILKHVGLLEAK